MKIKRIKENVKLLRQKDIDDARSDLNELDNEVRSIEDSIEQLQNVTAYEVIKDEISQLEENISKLRRQKSIYKQQINKLKPVSEKVNIDKNEVQEFYNQLKEGLGNLIVKDLEEILNFKSKIDDFQNQLLGERRDSLQNHIVDIDKEIVVLDKRYSECLAVLDKKGELKNLKQTY